MTPRIDLLTLPAGTPHQTEVVAVWTRPHDLHTLLYKNSNHHGLKHCSKLNRCQSILCPTCSTRRSSRARAAARGSAANHDSALYAVLSTEAHPDLSQAWTALSTVRRRFLALLHGYTWTRHTEVTYSSSGWHLHDNLLVFGERHQLDELKKEILPAWLDAAARTGIAAHPAAQYADIARSTEATIVYSCKGIMRPGTHGSTTPGDILQGYYRGDADAADQWEQLETFVSSRRVWSSTSRKAPTSSSANITIRKPRGKTYTPAQLAALPQLTPKQIMNTLGCSRSTAYTLLAQAAA